MTADQTQLFYRRELSLKLSSHPSCFSGWKHSQEDGGGPLGYEEVQDMVRAAELVIERYLLGAKQVMSKDEFKLLKIWLRKERRERNI
jgi:hypothetical protein